MLIIVGLEAVTPLDLPKAQCTKKLRSFDAHRASLAGLSAHHGKQWGDSW